ncbi:hypothetical protein B0H14DRAFT_3905024 [Mycena olivaceomarginata]|nr:hypothetical protein B0H14DRAFT_3905024 [Mycena olivaceomarginata]
MFWERQTPASLACAAYQIYFYCATQTYTRSLVHALVHPHAPRVRSPPPVAPAPFSLRGYAPVPILPECRLSPSPPHILFVPETSTRSTAPQTAHATHPASFIATTIIANRSLSPSLRPLAANPTSYASTTARRVFSPALDSVRSDLGDTSPALSRPAHMRILRAMVCASPTTPRSRANSARLATLGATRGSSCRPATVNDNLGTSLQRFPDVGDLRLVDERHRNETRKRKIIVIDSDDEKLDRSRPAHAVFDSASTNDVLVCVLSHILALITSRLAIFLPFNVVLMTTPQASKGTTAGNNTISFKGAQIAVTTQSAPGLEVLVNYPQNAATAPTTTANVDGAKVNAFYILNTIHVLSYRYGFTEAAFYFLCFSSRKPMQSASGRIASNPVFATSKNAAAARDLKCDLYLQT